MAYFNKKNSALAFACLLLAACGGSGSEGNNTINDPLIPTGNNQGGGNTANKKRVLSVHLDDGGTQQELMYHYDDQGLLLKVTHNDNAIKEYHYTDDTQQLSAYIERPLAAANRQDIQYAEQYTYSDDGLLHTFEHSGMHTEPVAYRYQYDDNDTLEAIVIGAGSNQLAYHYQYTDDAVTVSHVYGRTEAALNSDNVLLSSDSFDQHQRKIDYLRARYDDSQRLTYRENTYQTEHFTYDDGRLVERRVLLAGRESEKQSLIYDDQGVLITLHSETNDKQQVYRIHYEDGKCQQVKKPGKAVLAFIQPQTLTAMDLLSICP